MCDFGHRRTKNYLTYPYLHPVEAHEKSGWRESNPRSQLGRLELEPLSDTRVKAVDCIVSRIYNPMFLTNVNCKWCRWKCQRK